MDVYSLSIDIKCYLSKISKHVFSELWTNESEESKIKIMA